jgi:hypothetical protein
MDARVRHRSGEDAQRHGDSRLRGRYSGRERDPGCRVAGRQRARAGQTHAAWERRPAVGTPASAERLQRRVHDRGGDGNRSQAVGGRTPAVVAARDRQQAARRKPESRVVGRVRQPAHRRVERRAVRARDRGVDAPDVAEQLVRVEEGEIV